MRNMILEKFVLPLGDKILGSRFMEDLKLLREQDTMHQAALSSLQEEKLKKLLHYAVNHSEYYKRLGIRTSNNPLKMLKSFPILTKETLRQETDALLTVPSEDVIVQKSSGSSGFQTTVYFNKTEQSMQRAQQIRWWEWAGYRIGDPILQTGITPNRGIVKRVKDILFRTYYMPAFAHSEKTVLEALKWANKQKEPVLAGYASSLYVLATIAQKHGLKVSFKTAISWGDKLFEHYKNKIEDVFDVNVFNTYASSEGFMIAAQKDLPYMYIMCQHVYLEIVDDEGNEVPDGTLGHVVVTNLNNFTMPLIRYRLGDLAVKLPREKYPKKRQYAYPLLEKVIGRDTDLIKTRNGKFMVVHSFTGILEHYSEIKQYKVIQRDLDGIEIEYIPDKHCSAVTLDKIKKELLRYLQEDNFYINFRQVDYIAPSPSGKPQIIQSYLKG